LFKHNLSTRKLTLKSAKKACASEKLSLQKACLGEKKGGTKYLFDSKILIFA